MLILSVVRRVTWNKRWDRSRRHHRVGLLAAAPLFALATPSPRVHLRRDRLRTWKTPVRVIAK